MMHGQTYIKFVTCFVSGIEMCSKPTQGRTETPVSWGDAGNRFKTLN